MAHRPVALGLIALMLALLAGLSGPGLPAQAAETPVTSDPVVQTTAPAPPTDPVQQQAAALIHDYSERAGMPLTLFGDRLRHDMADMPPDRGALLPLGNIDGDYMLGPGDQLRISLRGQQDRDFTVTVDRSGQIVLDKLPPVIAAGRSLDQFTHDLNQQVTARFLDTSSFVSLDRLREIAVVVTGAVAHPGTVRLSSLSTPLDALEAAGGVLPLGSLRAIALDPAHGSRQTLDLYALLLGGPDQASRQPLKNGDRLHVPPLGPTVALAGDLKRPGIFELPADQSRIGLDEALLLGGGPLRPGAARITLSRLDEHGLEHQQPVGTSDSLWLRDGDLLNWRTARSIVSGGIAVTGHSGAAGRHALQGAESLGRLLRQPGVMLPDTYPLFALIGRRADPSGEWRYLPFSPRAIIDGTQDRRLQDRDRVLLFAADRFPLPPIVVATADDTDEASETKPADTAGTLDDEALRALTAGLEASIDGAVRRPGRYPLAAGVAADTLIAQAGGLLPDHDVLTASLDTARTSDTGTDSGAARQLALTDLAVLTVAAGDALRINSADQSNRSRAVRISGAVVHPGLYHLAPGAHLSDLLDRAGGLTAEAFPAGAIFTRASERRREQDRNLQVARELDQAVARLLARADRPDRDLVEMTRNLAAELRRAETLGRITVEASPGILHDRPDLDPLLQDGDRLFYPERSLTVRVAGEVQAPAALQFSADKTASEYLKQAGGFTRLADSDRAFVILPDGSARPLKISAWNHDPVPILPGSTIVAPRDPKPFDGVELTANIGNILSQIAITAASIATITDRTN